MPAAHSPEDGYDVDVVVVGYGPVGQTLAGLLGRLGHRVRVFERHADLYGYSRAGHLEDEILRIVQPLGIAQELHDQSTVSLTYTMQGATPDTSLTLTFPRDASSLGWMADYSFYQPDLESLLDRTARALPTVEVEMGMTVTDLAHDADGVDVYVVPTTRPDDEPRRLRARYVVACDGAKSPTRERLGIRHDDLGFLETELVIDLLVHDPAVKAAIPQSVQIAEPSRPRSAFKEMGPKHSRVELMVMPGEDPDDMLTDAKLWPLLGEWNLAPENSEIVRRSHYTFRSLIAHRWRDGRILLIGDAVHVMPPFLGQGLCSGVRDAANLVWKLDLVLSGRAGDALLDTIEIERRPQVRSVTEESVRMGSMILETDPAKIEMRDAMLRTGHLPPPSRAGMLSGVLSGAASGQVVPPVGTVSPQMLFSDRERTALMDDITGARWRLLTRDPQVAPALQPKHRALLDTLGMRMFRLGADGDIDDVDGRFYAWLDGLDVHSVIIRPDGYVFGVASSTAQAVALLDELDELIPRAAAPSLQQA